jgi:hypothetical protein
MSISLLVTRSRIIDDKTYVQLAAESGISTHDSSLRL